MKPIYQATVPSILVSIENSVEALIKEKYSGNLIKCYYEFGSQEFIVEYSTEGATKYTAIPIETLTDAVFLESDLLQEASMLGVSAEVLSDNTDSYTSYAPSWPDIIFKSPK